MEGSSHTHGISRLSGHTRKTASGFFPYAGDAAGKGWGIQNHRMFFPHARDAALVRGLKAEHHASFPHTENAASPEPCLNHFAIVFPTCKEYRCPNLWIPKENLVFPTRKRYRLFNLLTVRPHPAPSPPCAEMGLSFPTEMAVPSRRCYHPAATTPPSSQHRRHNAIPPERPQAFPGEFFYIRAFFPSYIEILRFSNGGAAMLPRRNRPTIQISCMNLVSMIYYQQEIQSRRRRLAWRRNPTRIKRKMPLHP